MALFARRASSTRDSGTDEAAEISREVGGVVITEEMRELLTPQDIADIIDFFAVPTGDESHSVTLDVLSGDAPPQDVVATSAAQPAERSTDLIGRDD